MKPSWDDAPEWANWLAMDPDGQWYWYSHQPRWDSRLEMWHTEREGRWEEAFVHVYDPKSSREPRP